MKLFYIALGITGGLTLLMWLSPATFVTTVNGDEAARISQAVIQQGGNQGDADEYVANLEIAREAIVKSDAGRSFLFIALAAGLLFMFIRKAFNPILLAGGLTVLMAGDMWGVSHRYLHDKNEYSEGNYERSKKKEVPYYLSKADEMILQDKDPAYRVLNMAVDVWQDASTSYFHRSIGGYHGAKLKRIQELYEQVMEKQIGEIRTSLGMKGSDSLIDIAISHQGTVNMLNTKYIIYNPDGGVIPNKYACGAAWFVDEVKQVESADAEIQAVKDFDPKKTAIVDKRFATQVAGFAKKADSTATIKVVSHAPDKIVYESNSSVEQIAVFSEIYYDKGWNVTINEKPAEHFRADYVLRGLKVPAGKNTIEFVFHPDNYYTGEKIAMIGSLLLFLTFGAGIFMQYRKKKNVPVQ